MMTNRTYDILKYIFTIILPALATLYVALANIWGLPYADNIAGTIAAIVVFANTALAIKSARYNASLPVLMDEDDMK